MLTIMRFDRGWMVSREARSRFMIMSVLSILLGIIFVFMTYLPAIFDGNRQPLFVRTVLLIIAVPAIVGGLFMFFGMEWYCLEVDPSRKPIRLLQAFAMLCTAPFGQVIYCLLIYRPQTQRVEMRII